MPDCGCSLLNRGCGFYEQPLYQLGGEREEVVAAAGSERGQQLRSYDLGINAVGVGLEPTDECRMQRTFPGR